MANSVLTFSLLLLGVVSVTSQLCSQQVTCRDCIKTSPSCVWCSQEDFNVTKRCFHRNVTDSFGCPKSDQQDPQSKTEHQEGTLSLSNLVIPEVVNITLRPGIPTTFNITVRSARNFPLDLYLLTDISASLSDDIQTLRVLQEEITNSLSNISSNYKIGFGTFVDKPILPYSIITRPYISILPGFGKTCKSGLRQCSSPFGYRHVLNLTDNTTEFAIALDNIETSLGSDTFEGGLDALLQAVVCQEIVGWRSQARRIVLYISDAITHTAGDGRLAAIVQPNDGECHMAIPDGGSLYEYSDWAIRDYTTMGQVAGKLSNLDTIVIFAVTDGVINAYEDLAASISRAFVSELSSDSSNIVDIIVTQYEILRGTISIEPEQVPGITVSVTPLEGCTNRSSSCIADKECNECVGVPVDGTVVFQVNVTADTCTFRNRFEMGVPGFGRVIVNAKPLCNCDCQQNAIPNSPECRNGTGTKVCGVCDCSSSGQAFQCPTGQSSVACSGNGVCTSCGKCVCNRLENGNYYYGDACECDNFSCDEGTDDLLCSGNGKCCNSACVCDLSSKSGKPFTGIVCECTPDNDTCLNGRKEVCSNHGQCRCGRCECNDEYTGDFCQSCIRESCQPCNLYPNCALCGLNLISDRCSNCTNTRVTIDSQLISSADVDQCNVIHDGCTYDYFIIQDPITGIYNITVDPECTGGRGNNIALGLLLGLAIGIPILIIIIGLILLAIIKLLFVIKDRQELKRFENSIREADWTIDGNPLYVSPEIEYQNVAYKKKKGRGSMKKD